MRSAQGRTTLHVVWLSTVPFRIDSRGSQPPAQASHFSPGAVELQGVAPAWRRATSVRVSASISASVFTPAAAAPRAWHVGAFAVQFPACVHAQHKEGCVEWSAGDTGQHMAGRVKQEWTHRCIVLARTMPSGPAQKGSPSTTSIPFEPGGTTVVVFLFKNETRRSNRS